MQIVKTLIALAVILSANVLNIEAQQLQVSSSGFMMNPGDEAPPIGVYPTKDEGGTDSLENDVKDKVEKKKKKKDKNKDQNGNPAGTIYWNNAEKGVAAACLIGKEIIKKQKESAETTVIGTIQEIYTEVKEYFFPTDNESKNEATHANASSTKQCTHFQIPLNDKPSNFKNKYGKGLQTLAKSKQWHKIVDGYVYISMNKIKKYAYVYFAKKKPNKSTKYPAIRFKVRIKKKKIILLPFN